MPAWLAMLFGFRGPSVPKPAWKPNDDFRRSRCPDPCGAHSCAATVLALLAAPRICAADDVSHEVRQGENPWTISTRYLRSMALWPRLVTYNRIPDALRIAPGTVLRIPENWLARRRVPATVLAVNGDVLLTDARGRQTRLKPGDALPEGAILKTGAQQNLSLGLLDNSRVLVRSDSELRLESNAEIALDRTRSILLDLRHGALESEVAKRSSSGGRFEIRTPAGTAAVRGTSFRIAASEREDLDRGADGRGKSRQPRRRGQPRRGIRHHGRATCRAGTTARPAVGTGSRRLAAAYRARAVRSAIPATGRCRHLPHAVRRRRTLRRPAVRPDHTAAGCPRARLARWRVSVARARHRWRRAAKVSTPAVG